MTTKLSHYQQALAIAGEGYTLDIMRSWRANVGILLVACGLLGGNYLLGQIIGGAPPGGASVIGRPAGVNEKDELKDFHRAMALQATPPQADEFRALLKSTDAASREFEALAKSAGDSTAAANDANEARARGFQQKLEKARTGTNQFLDALSPAQKAGLRDVIAKLSRAGAELGEQLKMLDAGDARDEASQIAARAESLRKALANFRNEQASVAQEMGIVEAESGTETAFKIPVSKRSVKIGGQTVELTSSTVLSRPASGNDLYKVEATTELEELQGNLSAILAAMLDKQERCGERIAVREATLEPQIPWAVAMTRLRYERWLCSRGLAGEASHEMAEGNATVEVKLTPRVSADGKLEFVTEVGRVDAERFLTDLLRSGGLGDELREKISNAVLAAIPDLKTALGAVGESATVQGIRFQSPREDELNVVVNGEVRMTAAQAKEMEMKAKEMVEAGKAQ